MGKRTVERVIENIAVTPQMSQVPRHKGKPIDRFCKSVCDVLCVTRDSMVGSLFRDNPAWEDIIRDVTDYKTLIDIRKGANCPCSCPVSELADKLGVKIF